MKIKDVLKTGSDYLKKRGIKSSFLDSELILAKVLKKPRIWILANYHSNIRKNVGMKFLKLIRKRGEHYPIAYLLSEKEFYGLTFFVNNILIPRPETELLVDKSLEIIAHLKRHSEFTASRCKQSFATGISESHEIPKRVRDDAVISTRLASLSRTINILEIGTGSGCVSISILKFLTTNSQLPIPIFYATDISLNALKIAKQNAKLHGVDKYIQFIKSDLLDFILNKKYHSEFTASRCKQSFATGISESNEIPKLVRDDVMLSAQNDNHFDMIVSNLPYLDKSEIKDELKYEPRKALLGGKKSYDLIERLLIQVPKLKYKPKLVLLEINEKDSKILKNLAKKYLPEYSAKILKDLAGKDRVLELQSCA